MKEYLEKIDNIVFLGKKQSIPGITNLIKTNIPLDFIVTDDQGGHDDGHSWTKDSIATYQNIYYFACVLTLLRRSRERERERERERAHVMKQFGCNAYVCGGTSG
jgi:hypothetical protein